MNARNVGGALVLAGGTGLIGYGMYVTQSASPLWAIFLLAWFAGDFPWSKEK